MCLGGGSSDNGAMIKEQKAQATEARQKEVDRQNRLAQGLANIRAAFEGGNTTKTTSGQVTIPAYGSGATLPAGYSYVNVGATPGTPGTAAIPGYAPPVNSAARGQGGGGNRAEAAYGSAVPIGSGGGPGQARNNAVTQATAIGGTPATAGTAGTPGRWVVRGPDGALHEVGSTVGYDSTTTSSSGGGFGEDFYNRFRQGILDNFTPQVQQQYGEAKDQLTYNLARAGTGRSSVATDEAAKLANQNALANADVQAKADTGAADLRKRVADERSKAEAQLYATENPDVATNQALAAVNNISLAKPELSTLGEMFKTAAIGGANAITGYRNQSMINSLPPEYRRKATSVVPG